MRSSQMPLLMYSLKILLPDLETSCFYICKHQSLCFTASQIVTLFALEYSLANSLTQVPLHANLDIPIITYKSLKKVHLFLVI